MAEAHKYMFDLDFTPPHQRPKDVEAEGAEAVEAVVEDLPPAPMFTEEELNMARDGAFDEGRRSGYAEGLEAGGSMIAQSLDALVQALPGVVHSQNMANELILHDAVRLTMATLRRALPATAEANAFAEVAKVVADLVPHLLDEPRIIVRVAPVLVDTIRTRLEQIAQSTGFEGRMVVQEDARLNPGDCKVEWADGGAERDLVRMLAEMEEVVDRALASAPVPISGDGPTAPAAPTHEETVNG